MKIIKKQQGFTMMELMIVITLMAILMSMSVVSYQKISYRTAMRALSNDIAGVITQARVYAMTVGENVAVCPFVDAVPPINEPDKAEDYPSSGKCAEWNIIKAGNADGRIGWVVFRDPDGDKAIGNNKRDILKRMVFDDHDGKVGLDMTETNVGSEILFKRKGSLASTGATITITSSNDKYRGEGFDRQVVIAATGRISNKLRD